MLTVDKILPRGAGLARTLVARAAHVALNWDVRQKSRFDAVDSLGRRIGVFLPRGTVVRGGDLLVVEDGTLVRVDAAPQPVALVRAAPGPSASFDLMRAAYHLGNRHVPLELQPDHLKFEPDHVLAQMLALMGLVVTEANRPFEPEGGAYGADHGRGHAHGHGHAHLHDRGHAHAHDHGQGPHEGGGHVHGPHCRHGHAH